MSPKLDAAATDVEALRIEKYKIEKRLVTLLY